jgi:hypothetical protein
MQTYVEPLYVTTSPTLYETPVAHGVALAHWACVRAEPSLEPVPASGALQAGVVAKRTMRRGSAVLAFMAP